MSGLTPRDARVLTYLQRAITDTHSPSYAEIGVNCGLSSKSNVFQTIERLIRLGHVRKTPGLIRGLALTDPFSGKPTLELMAMRDRIDRVLAGRAQ